MKNWKTTAGGLAAALGLLLITSPNPTTQLVGKLLAAVGAAFTGYAASDGKPSV